jgi:hypothetical protein
LFRLEEEEEEARNLLRCGFAGERKILIVLNLKCFIQAAKLCGFTQMLQWPHRNLAWPVVGPYGPL